MPAIFRPIWFGVRTKESRFSEKGLRLRAALTTICVRRGDRHPRTLPGPGRPALALTQFGDSPSSILGRHLGALASAKGKGGLAELAASCCGRRGEGGRLTPWTARRVILAVGATSPIRHVAPPITCNLACSAHSSFPSFPHQHTYSLQQLISHVCLHTNPTPLHQRESHTPRSRPRAFACLADG